MTFRELLRYEISWKNFIVVTVATIGLTVLALLVFRREPLEYWWWMFVYYTLNKIGSATWAIASWVIAGVIYRLVAPHTKEGRWRSNENRTKKR
jgi:lysylphosphatidylglycerol synthetase-like protein (DUF2156 family)